MMEHNSRVLIESSFFPANSWLVYVVCVPVLHVLRDILHKDVLLLQKDIYKR